MSRKTIAVLQVNENGTDSIEAIVYDKGVEYVGTVEDRFEEDHPMFLSIDTEKTSPELAQSFSNESGISYVSNAEEVVIKGSRSKMFEVLDDMLLNPENYR